MGEGFRLWRWLCRGPFRHWAGLEDWFQSAESQTTRARRVLRAHEVLKLTDDELRAKIVEDFKRLFPLVLLATSSNPVEAIGSYLEELLGPAEDVEQQQPYSRADLLRETSFQEEILTDWLAALERKKQAILYGPPGTGKTYVAERIAKYLTSQADGLVELVQFHPSYSYEEFVQGIRPQTRDGGGLEYPLTPGRFLLFCDRARSRKGTCVLIIDEINRANLSKVFGELMYLLEYRDRTIQLAGGKTFSIPSNVRVIGTMNTADRSIALVDHALRRRFAFLELAPDYDVLRSFHAGNDFPVDKLVEILQALNTEIADRHYAIGVSFFLRQTLAEDLESVWRTEIEPYLDEYFFDNPGRVDSYRWNAIAEKLGE